MTIPALPDAPALGDSPEVFNTKAFAFVAALDDWGTAVNAVAAEVDADATAADTDAATATTQAGIATTKANEAAASAVDANSAELGAQAAQTAAELAATNAAASYDSFDDRYLGAKSSDPSVDNDGGALIIGALYFNTTDQKMKVYATLGWKDAGSAVNGSSRRQTFTATTGQTSFTVTDGYDANFADVYLNGVKLVNGTDVTVSSGTAVVLASGAAAGDVLDVVAYGAFEVANTYTQSQADATFLTKSNPNYTGTLTGGTGVANLGSGQFYKDASGNVGIGTSSPSQELHVYRSSGATDILIEQASSGNAYVHTKNTSKEYAVGTRTDALAFYDVTADAERMRIDSSGNLLVKTVTQDGLGISFNPEISAGAPYATFNKSYNGNASGINFKYNSTTAGGITYNNASVAYNTTSDYRLKENVAPMVGALEKVALLKPVTYTWKADGTDGQGFIAHELQEVCPDAVSWEKDAMEEDGVTPKYQGIDTSFLVATLTKAIQEQQALITTLTERVAALEGAQQ